MGRSTRVFEGPPGKVLIVDDYAASAIAGVFRSHIGVVVARSLEQGIDMVERSQRLAAELIDWRLSEDGKVTAEPLLARSRALYPTIPIWVITGAANERVVRKAALAHHALVLPKPVSTADVIEPCKARAALLLSRRERLEQRAGMEVLEAPHLFAVEALLDGASDAAIADALGVSVAHVRSLCREAASRLRLRSCEELLRGAWGGEQ